MLKNSILNKLNGQITKELESAYLYFSMMSYFESISLKGFAHWMKLQAQEELGHAMRFFAYVNDKSMRVKSGAIASPKNEWDSPLDAIEDLYQHECLVSELINECVSLAIKENDHSTNTFLLWFVSEQVEEEASADEVVQKLKLIGDNSSGLFLLDTELGKRSAEDAEGAGA